MLLLLVMVGRSRKVLAGLMTRHAAGFPGHEPEV